MTKHFACNVPTLGLQRKLVYSLCADLLQQKLPKPAMSNSRAVRRMRLSRRFCAAQFRFSLQQNIQCTDNLTSF